MQPIVVTYFVYLTISIALTIWVAQTLFKNGRVFLVEVFHGDNTLADSVNHLLVVGFYLIYVSLMLKIGTQVAGARDAIGGTVYEGWHGATDSGRDALF